MSPGVKGAFAGVALALGVAGAAAAAGREPLYATVAQAWSGLAPCLASPGAIQALETPLAGEASAVARVGPARLTDTPARLEAFRAIARRAGRRTLALAADAGCKDVDCAMTAMFGPEAAPRILRLALRYRYVAADRRQAWSIAELDELALSFADLPADWFASAGGGYRSLTRRHGDVWSTTPTPPGLTLVAMAGQGVSGVLVLDGWDRLSASARRAALVHELGHEFARHKSGRWRREWLAAMLADQAMGAAERRAASVSAYADSNPEEDFAESVAAYRYMAPALKRRAPHRYAFLKARVFGELEYGSEAACRSPPQPAVIAAVDPAAGL